MPGARVASGKRVTLRTVDRSDLSFLSRATANPEIRYPLGAPVDNLAAHEERFEEGFGDHQPYLVCLDEEDAGPGPVDASMVTRIGRVMDVAPETERSRPRVGFWLAPEFQGEGYAKEAVSLLIDHLFRVNHHPAIGAEAFPHNEASRGVLESLGFVQEGRVRNDWFWDGQYRDYIQYGLLREDWHGQD